MACSVGPPPSQRRLRVAGEIRGRVQVLGLQTGHLVFRRHIVIEHSLELLHQALIHPFFKCVFWRLFTPKSTRASKLVLEWRGLQILGRHDLLVEVHRFSHDCHVGVRSRTVLRVPPGGGCKTPSVVRKILKRVPVRVRRGVVFEITVLVVLEIPRSHRPGRSLSCLLLHGPVVYPLLVRGRVPLIIGRSSFVREKLLRRGGSGSSGEPRSELGIPRARDLGVRSDAHDLRLVQLSRIKE